MKFIQSSFALAALLFCLVAGPSVQAETWPERPITMVFGFGAGGSGDTVARVLAEFASKELGQRVIVENRPGAGGVVATLDVAKAKPDGYTIMLQAVGPMIQRPILDPSVGFDALKDFTPIVLLGDTPNIILAGSKFPVQSIKEMVEWAKKNPGHMTVGHPGTGTMGHLGALMLGSKAGFKAIYIAYRSGGQVLPDILGGQIDAGCVAYAPQFKSAHILAVMTPDRVDFLPGVPSMREAGYPGVYASTWYALYGPRGLPPEIVAKLNSVVNDFLRRDDARSRFAALGLRTLGGTPEDLTKKMIEDTAIWSKVIKDADIKLIPQK